MKIGLIFKNTILFLCLPFMLSVCVIWYIETEEYKCELNYDQFSERWECYKESQFPLHIRNNKDLAELKNYRGYLLCADSLKILVTQKILSDDDAWTLLTNDFSSYIRNNRERCADQQALDELKQLKKKSEEYRRLQMENNTVWREGGKMVARPLSK